jgi:hypothetical protein
MVLSLDNSRQNVEDHTKDYAKVSLWICIFLDLFKKRRNQNHG